MKTKLFDSKRDRKYPYFCGACLVGKTEMSLDPRYCQGCYEFLLEEAKMLSGTRRPQWIPNPKITGEKPRYVPQQGNIIKSTLKEEKSKVDTIQPPTLLRPQAKRGPKHRVLPEDLIRSLAADGMGSKAIVSKLKAEQGIVVSYKTIQRLLSGGREFDKQTENKLSDKQGNLALLQHLILK